VDAIQLQPSALTECDQQQARPEAHRIHKHLAPSRQRADAMEPQTNQQPHARQQIAAQKAYVSFCLPNPISAILPLISKATAHTMSSAMRSGSSVTA
jgi:hypothetical protein